MMDSSREFLPHLFEIWLRLISTWRAAGAVSCTPPFTAREGALLRIAAGTRSFFGLGFVAESRHPSTSRTAATAAAGQYQRKREPERMCENRVPEIRKGAGGSSV
jgi:hypothetical protein